ncbi:sulfate transporter family protein [Mangrovibrevibacter kandeliae]|uniref:sulfate transporter family protein n=1 Tax=Mangrovibrevibacter kandeliae TaxID=2968473 RepID=UPI0021194F85|nr:sulfate transporter family protein [Aurantimonas sp. CSK15Z-1]MCQ8784301.1 sulfate transporter family protein [Aurantimonas sp. CSK15Z-1]
MILSAAFRALSDVLSPPFRAVLWKTLGLTVLVLIGGWFAVQALFEHVAIPFFAQFSPDMPAWLDEAGLFAGWAAGLLLALLLTFLIAPISAVIAGLFLDDVAEVVERGTYPAQPPGRPLPFFVGVWSSIKFFGIVILGNLLAFALLLVPGVNLVAFFLVNGYLLGREYFEFAAMRYRPEADARAMRRRHAATVFGGGLAIGAVLAVPVLNLLTPLFAAAMMVHLHQRLSLREGSLGVAGVSPATDVPPTPRPVRRPAEPAEREAPAGRSS